MAVNVINNGGLKKFALLSEEAYKALRNTNQATKQIQSAEFRHIKTLDEEIRRILQNKSLDDGRKIRLYATILNKYLTARSKAPEIVGRKRSIEYKSPSIILSQQQQPIVKKEKNMQKEEENPAGDEEEEEELDNMEEDIINKEEEDDEDEFQDAPLGLVSPMAVAASTNTALVPAITSDSDARKEQAAELGEALKKHPDIIKWNDKGEVSISGNPSIPGVNITELIDYATKAHLPQKKPAGGRSLINFSTYVPIEYDTCI